MQLPNLEIRGTIPLMNSSEHTNDWFICVFGRFIFIQCSCMGTDLHLYKFLLKKFIVSRYKQETNLIQTTFFRNQVPFILCLPDYLSAGFFGTHLMMCVWG